MSFQGNLQGIGLADVFQNIASKRTEGTVHVKWRSGVGLVRFEEGAVSGYSSGPGKPLPLLRHVVQRGYVSERPLDNLVKKNRKSRKPIGRMMVETGLLSAEELAGTVAEMIEQGV